MSAEHPSRTETATDSKERTTHGSGHGWGSILLGLTGLLFVLQGLSSVYRALFTDQFESGVHTLGGTTGAQLAATNPELASYVAHLQVNGGALAAIVGIAILVLVQYGIRQGHLWAWTTAVAMPLIYLSVLVPLHLASGFDFHTLQHLGPVAIGVPIVLAGAVLAYRDVRGRQPSSTHSTGGA